MDTSNTLIAGDFYLHIDNESNKDTKRLVDILKAADLTQHVEDQTYAAGHIIDLLITRSSVEFLKNIRTNIPHMSDDLSIHHFRHVTHSTHLQRVCQIT